MFSLFVIFTLLLFATTALRWGVDTRDDVDSAEWERRRIWRGRW